MSVVCEDHQYNLPVYLLHGVPVWLYDVVRASEEFSAAAYQCLARYCIDAVLGRDKLPVIVGGTGYYIDSIFGQKEAFGIPPDPGLRAALATKNTQQLQEELKSVSPGVWNSLNASDRKNPRRLVRKIELANSGTIRSPAWRNDLDVLWVGLAARDTAHLYGRIDERVDKRVKQGVIVEIETLLAQGYSWDSPAFNSHGYRQWRGYFAAPLQEKEHARAAAVMQWKFDEHAYARRQMTWFKRNNRIRWHFVDTAGYAGTVAELVRQWYTQNTS
jgi:tRNA dimethylallyltransferase